VLAYLFKTLYQKNNKMETPNVELMQMARQSLAGKWGLAIGTLFGSMLIFGLLCVIPILGQLGALLLAGPYMLGLATFSLNIARDEDAQFEQVFKGFNNFATALGLYLLQAIIVFLFTLLLIVPGVMRAISYSMSYYILADNPGMAAMGVLDESKRMMEGYKMKYFRLMLRFFGLSLLCILTLGIGYLWLAPYIQVTHAKFYEDLKKIHGEELI